jgi:hypothetical protein
MRLFKANKKLQPEGLEIGRFGVSNPKVVGLVVVCLTVFAALAQAETYIVAHVPFGGGWSTRLIFANSGSADVTADVAFFSSTTGQTGSVPLEGLGLQSAAHLAIGKNQTTSLNVDPTKRNATTSVNVMWATVTTTGPLNILSLFDSSVPTTVPSMVPATLVTGAVGAQSVQTATSFRFPISVNGPLHFNAGMAISNPNASSVGFTVHLLNADGTTRDTAQKTLPAKEQTSFVVTDPTIFPNGNFPATLFTGSIAVCSTQPLGLVTIGIEGGALYTISVTNDLCP